MYFNPITNAQEKGPIRKGRPKVSVCEPCSRIRFDEYKKIAKAGGDPGVYRMVGTMDRRAHDRTVHPA